VLLLAGSALLYGIRHGVDWDHLAAITEVTSTQSSPRRGLVVASAYAAGHGVVVFVLGVVAILGRDVIPPGIDAVMGRIAGVTLLVLAVAVVVGLLRDRHDFRLRSRWMLVAAGVARARRWVQEPAEVVSPGSRTAALDHRHEHVHMAMAPLDPFAAPGVPTATWIGMLHGIGAETPTQVLIFLTAAQVAGGAAGVGLLVCFIAGIFVSNTAVAVAASFGYLSATRSFPLYAGIASLNALASAAIGTVLVTGGTLPPILGG
jgi:high-affinity nickel-transport protein